MDPNDRENQLDALWAEYRQAYPDPEAGAGFMPGLWQRIESRRVSNLSIFRRVAQVCVGATVTLTVLMGVVLIPHMQRIPVYSASYVDVLTANHPNSYLDVLTGDIK
jgi:hypothetical protein